MVKEVFCGKNNKKTKTQFYTLQNFYTAGESPAFKRFLEQSIIIKNMRCELGRLCYSNDALLWTLKLAEVKNIWSTSHTVCLFNNLQSEYCKIHVVE